MPAMLSRDAIWICSFSNVSVRIGIAKNDAVLLVQLTLGLRRHKRSFLRREQLVDVTRTFVSFHS